MRRCYLILSFSILYRIEASATTPATLSAKLVIGFQYPLSDRSICDSAAA